MTERLKVLIKPHESIDMHNFVLSLPREGLDLRQFIAAIHQRLVSAGLFAGASVSDVTVEYFLKDLQHYALLDEEAFVYLVNDSSCTIRVGNSSSSIGLPPTPVSGASETVPKLRGASPTRPTLPKREPKRHAALRRRRMQVATSWGEKVDGRHSSTSSLGMRHVEKPSVAICQPSGKSIFSNSPLIGGRAINDEYEGSTSAPGWLQLLHKFSFYTRQLLFYLTMVLNSLHLIDGLIIGAVVAATHLLFKYDVQTDVSPSLFMSILVFPLSFSVQSAYQRREKALADLSTIKGSTLNLFLLYKDWSVDVQGLGLQFIYSSGNTIIHLFTLIRLYLTCKYEPHKEYYLQGVYTKFAEIASLSEHVRKVSKQPAPLFTRPIHDLQLMISSFEQLRVTTDYRTPTSIRSFTKVFIVVLSFLLTPYFTFIGMRLDRAAEENEPLDPDRPWSAGQALALLLAFATPLMFTCLQNVQIQLENPFGTDSDDINLDYLRSVDTITNLISREIQQQEFDILETPHCEESQSLVSDEVVGFSHRGSGGRLNSNPLIPVGGAPPVFMTSPARVSSSTTAREEDMVVPTSLP
eukprot:TRINITY_DN67251_c10_g1_i1.p1 TRINITY_DN67251_c10_g1~~TRINITY_DN67251_c10_g1_i1.p1  ORF type:complete len:580 (+),score=32.29 TRINITY_DN67251_c10_g1_i1:48-1787(+)